MGALIVQDPRVSGAVTHDDERLAADLRTKVVASVANLTFVPDIDPGFAEDAFQFELENCGVRVKAAMDAGRLNKVQVIFR
jgi:hypothetical protein